MKRVQFRKVIERFAFSLQLAGVNTLQFDQVQELFSSEERILLQHNSLITVSGDYWSFNNALMQEHLAASLLTKLGYEKIIQYCAVGKARAKLKTKWIQTISSTLSILEKNSELFNKLLRFIEGDNIELIFLTEASKHTSDFKLSILQRFIEKCIRENVRPIIVYEETIGVFIENALACLDLLIEKLADPQVTDLVKIVCARIIKNCSLTEFHQDKIMAVVFNEISNTDNADYAGNLVELLTVNKIGDRELVNKLISMPRIREQHSYRDRIYEYILRLELVEEFYDYGLAGIPFHLKYNESITHGGSERRLQELLLGTNDYRRIGKLLERNSSTGKFEFLDFDGRLSRDFIQAVFEKLKKIFRKNPLIILAVARYIKNLGKGYRRREGKEADEFLTDTQSHSIIVRLLINDIMNEGDWELSGLITKESYDYVLWEYEQGEYGINTLRSLIAGIQYKGKGEVDVTFYKLCLDAIGGEIENKEASQQYSVYQEAERIKRSNDLKYIQSLSAFKSGIRKYFRDYGKKSISEDALYIDTDRASIRHQSDSYFLYNYLVKWVRRPGRIIHESDALETIEKQSDFEFFRAAEIMEYGFADESVKNKLVPYLREYYLKEINSAEFENCLFIEDGHFRWRKKEMLLGEIFRKYKFVTPEKYLIELVWLDQSGVSGFDSPYKKEDSIAEMILNSLDKGSHSKLGRKVLENMRIGIKMESVLGTHIALCKRLRIVGANDLILDAIKKSNHESNFRNEATKIYLEIGGDTEKIAGIFREWKGYNDYYFIHLAEILRESHGSLVIDIGLKALKHVDTTREQKIYLAELLAQTGSLEAFSYLVSCLNSTKMVPEQIGKGRNIGALNTKEALAIIDEIMYLLDEKYNAHRFFTENPRHVILEWIYQLAAKSESDLLEVEEFLEKCKLRLSGTIANAKDINWYIHRIFENFRSSDKTILSISEIKKNLSELELTIEK